MLTAPVGVTPVHGISLSQMVAAFMLFVLITCL